MTPRVEGQDIKFQVVKEGHPILGKDACAVPEQDRPYRHCKQRQQQVIGQMC